MANQVEISVDYHTGQSSAYFSKSSEGEQMETKEEFQKEQEPGMATSMEKDANSKVLSNVSENCGEKKKIYGCPLCLVRFTVPSELKRHCLTHTNQRPFQCPICCHRFRERSHLKVHISTHAKKKKKPLLHRHRFSHKASLTIQSDANSTEQNSVAVHLNKTSSDVETCGLKSTEGRWCPLCLKGFKTQSKLKRHILIHTEQKPFECFVCSKTFQQRSHLKVHKCKGKVRPACYSFLRGRLVGDNKVVQNEDVCFAVRILPTSRVSDGCVLQFKRKSGYQCDTCFEVFSTPSKLKQHQLTHMGSKRHTCQICWKPFKQACNLYKHLELHKGKRKHPSKVCDVKEKDGGSSSTLGASGGSNNSQNYEMLQCDIRFNQNVLLTTSGEVESSDTLRDTDEQNAGGKDANQCVICMKTFKFPYRLSRHLLTHTDVKPFKCRVCLKSFRYLYHLQRHKKIHQKTFENRIPPFSSSSNVTFTHQIKKKSGHQCDKCLKIFSVPSKLAKHQSVHSDTKPFTCMICQRSFIHASSLRKHLKLHGDKRNNSSQLHRVPQMQETNSGALDSNNCGMNDVNVSLPDPVETQTNEIFPDHSHVNQDVSLTVTNIKIESSDTEEQIADSSPSNLKHTSNQCRVCLKKFLYPSRLTRHLLSHTDLRPFKCSMCPKSFRNKYHLRRHKKIHKHSEKNKPFRLSEVQRKNYDSSSTQGALDGSSLNRGNVSLPHDCQEDIFDKMAVAESNTVKTESDSEDLTTTSTYDMDGSSTANQCSICLKSFPYPSKLYRHLLTHTEEKTFNCSLCSKSFRNQNKLHNHQKFHRKEGRKRFAAFSDPVYQCEICFKKFNFPSKLKRHLSVHSDDKPYPCTYCGKSFRLPEYLSEHLKIHTAKISPSSTLHGVPESANSDGTDNEISDSVDTQTNETLECGSQDLSLTTTTANSSPSYQKNKSEDVNQCAICLKTFPCHSSLYKHLLSHEDFTPLKCNVCWKSFRYQYNLESHKKTHQKISQEVIAGDLKQVSGSPVTSKDQNPKISSKDVATVHQVQNKLPDNVLPQKMSGDCSDSGGLSSNGTSFHGDVAPDSEFAIQSSNKSVWGLTHNTDISVLVEKKAPHIVPFGSVSERPPTVESSVQDSKVRTEETWTRHTGDIKEEISFVESDTIKHVPDSSITPSCLYPQSVDNPSLREPDVLKPLSFQDPVGFSNEPQHDFLICSDCGQSFPTELEYYAHKCTKLDPNEKKKLHQCDICFKVFNVPSKLKRHSVTHTGKKPFQCPHCEKSFTQSHHMKTHRLTHGFEKLPQGLSSSL